jgi:hypothetical protein
VQLGALLYLYFIRMIGKPQGLIGGATENEQLPSEDGPGQGGTGFSTQPAGSIDEVTMIVGRALTADKLATFPRRRYRGSKASEFHICDVPRSSG